MYLQLLTIHCCNVGHTHKSILSQEAVVSFFFSLSRMIILVIIRIVTLLNLTKFSLSLKKLRLLESDSHCLLFPGKRSCRYSHFSWGWLKLDFFIGSRSLCDLYFNFQVIHFEKPWALSTWKLARLLTENFTEKYPKMSFFE